MGELAKTIIILGIVLIIVGAVLLVTEKLPWGRLPGDILIKKEHVTFYFPLVTSIVVSIIVSLILYLIGKFR